MLRLILNEIEEKNDLIRKICLVLFSEVTTIVNWFENQEFYLNFSSRML